ncbi:MAG: reverse transcriptase-like protein, partial [Patescibacteria group bacterium]
MIRDFDRWNKRKKEIQTALPKGNFFYKEGEIWWCGLGVNLGVETDGKHDNFERPVLIIKVFNREMVWVLPVTSVFHQAPFYYKFDHGGEDQWVVLSQIRTVSTKRLFRKIRVLDETDFEKIKVLVIDYLKKRNPAVRRGISEPEGNNGSSLIDEKELVKPVIPNQPKIILYTDGGSRGNPGIAGAGAVITDEAGKVIKEASKPLGITTNNEAEYQGVILGLETTKKHFGPSMGRASKEKIRDLDITLKLDSELVAKQLRGEYQIKEDNLGKLFLKIWNARVADFPKLTITHIPREQNAIA